jgi:hypothetical protein
MAGPLAGDPHRIRVVTTTPLTAHSALDAGVPAAWVTADEVYGGSPTLRGWLEDRGVWHVLAVRRKT